MQRGKHFRYAPAQKSFTRVFTLDTWLSTALKNPVLQIRCFSLLFGFRPAFAQLLSGWCHAKNLIESGFYYRVDGRFTVNCT
jgi:hypothetical protein